MLVTINDKSMKIFCKYTKAIKNFIFAAEISMHHVFLRKKELNGFCL